MAHLEAYLYDCMPNTTEYQQIKNGLDMQHQQTLAELGQLAIE